MVGFRTIFILLSLMVLGACVPQVKQTDCSSNEAFNATLRTCVPVMNGPTSFINIKAISPLSPLSKYKSDTTTITLQTEISNPYALPYSISWERIYAGSSATLAATGTSYSFAPSLYISQLGTHIFVAKVKDGSGNVVDSHSFEIIIN
jgi:hypothetical protein